MSVQHFRLFCLFLIALVIPGAATQAQPTPDLAEIDRYLAEQVRANRMPGLAVAMIVDGEVALVRGYGHDSYGQPITGQTPFLIASVSKSFTALAVMQLAEAGQIDLDAPIGTYLPTFTTRDPVHDQQMTVRHLLNMVSGLSDAGYTEYPVPETLVARVQALATAQPSAAPGTTLSYFNPNYAVLAYLVEVISGQPFGDYMQANIFTPLQMRHTTSLVLSTEAATLAEPARGHVMAFGIPVAMPEAPGNLTGDGGVVTTADDMANYLMMQLQQGTFNETTLLKAESMALMHTPSGDGFYGMGWYVADPERQPRIVEHGGDLATFHADTVLLPDQQTGFILMYNFNYFPFMMTGFPAIKDGLIALMTGGTPPDYLSLSAFGLILGILTLLSLAAAFRGLLTTQRWAERGRRQPFVLRMMGIVTPLLPLVALILLPGIVLALIGRAIDRTYLFMALPELTLWLGVTGGIGLLTAVIRVRALLRLRPAG